MSESFGTSGWQFARVKVSLSDCSGLLASLLKQFKAEIFDSVEKTLKCKLERWSGPAAARWGWYGS